MEYIAGLGAITVPTSAADRIAFWRRLHDRLSALSNRIVDEQSKILDAVDERIPMPTPDELRDVHLENAKVDQRFWEGLRSACTPIRLKVTKAVIRCRRSELSPIAKQAPRTPPSHAPEAAKERIERIERGETKVQSGLGKSLTRQRS